MLDAWRTLSGKRTSWRRLAVPLTVALALMASSPRSAGAWSSEAPASAKAMIELVQNSSDSPSSVEQPPQDTPANADAPTTEEGNGGASSGPDGGDPAVQDAPEGGQSETGTPDADAPVSPTQGTAVEDDYVPPEIITDLARLPFPVRKMRELILEAAKTGDVEKLRPYIGYGADVTMLSLGGIDDDPVTFLKSLSGDGQGYEILAILIEVLESGFVHLDEGTDHELYVWPYYFAYPIDKLTPAQRVDLYKLVTHGDYEDMEAFGAYIFYRVGITPQGRWRFFVAGD
jgi:hypothetical protein